MRQSTFRPLRCQTRFVKGICIQSRIYKAARLQVRAETQPFFGLPSPRFKELFSSRSSRNLRTGKLRRPSLNKLEKPLPACTHVRVAEDLVILLDPKRDRIIYVLLAKGEDGEKARKIEKLSLLSKVNHIWFASDKRQEHDRLVHRVLRQSQMQCFEFLTGKETFTSTQLKLLENGVYPVGPAITAMLDELSPDAVDSKNSRLRRVSEMDLSYMELIRERALKSSRRYQHKRRSKNEKLIMACHLAIKELMINGTLSLVPNSDMGLLRFRRMMLHGGSHSRLSRLLGFEGPSSIPGMAGAVEEQIEDALAEIEEMAAQTRPLDSEQAGSKEAHDSESKDDPNIIDVTNDAEVLDNGDAGSGAAAPGGQDKEGDKPRGFGQPGPPVADSSNFNCEVQLGPDPDDMTLRFRVEDETKDAKQRLDDSEFDREHLERCWQRDDLEDVQGVPWRSSSASGPTSSSSSSQPAYPSPQQDSGMRRSTFYEPSSPSSGQGAGTGSVSKGETVDWREGAKNEPRMSQEFTPTKQPVSSAEQNRARPESGLQGEQSVSGGSSDVPNEASNSAKGGAAGPADYWSKVDSTEGGAGKDSGVSKAEQSALSVNAESSLPHEHSDEARDLARELLGREPSATEAAELVAALKEASHSFEAPDVEHDPQPRVLDELDYSSSAAASPAALAPGKDPSAQTKPQPRKLGPGNKRKGLRRKKERGVRKSAPVEPFELVRYKTPYRGNWRSMREKWGQTLLSVKEAWQGSKESSGRFQRPSLSDLSAMSTGVREEWTLRNMRMVASLVEALHRPSVMKGHSAMDLIVVLNESLSVEEEQEKFALEEAGVKPDLLAEVGNVWNDWEQELMGDGVEGVGMAAQVYLQKVQGRTGKLKK